MGEEELTEKEEDFYVVIKDKIEGLLKTRTNNFHLEITANRKYNNNLKAEIEGHRNIIFNFLNVAAPDITGFIKKGNFSNFIVIEIKKDYIKLDDIYQTKKYADLFSSKFTFLISLQPLPEEIKRLQKVTHDLLSFSTHLRYFSLVHFNSKCNDFVEWYPENPFEKDSLWK